MAKQSESHKKEKQNSEINEKVLYINRCSKVVKGGRKFSFRPSSLSVTAKVGSAMALRKRMN